MDAEEHQALSTVSQPQEFSFTVSQQLSDHETILYNSPISSPHKHSSASAISAAIDLSPADEIFFHGHLLPLHLLSHFSLRRPTSARSSTDSLDTFALPADQYLRGDDPNNTLQTTKESISNGDSTTTTSSGSSNCPNRHKSKKFSLFGFSRRRRVHGVRDMDDEGIGQTRRSKFDLNNILKRSMRLVTNPFLLFKGRGRADIEFTPQDNSFSSNTARTRYKFEQVPNRIDPVYSAYSAPASIRTSPTNSGLLVERPTGRPAGTTATVTDSTVEDLQAAIQAAIAYCKKSIAVEEQKEERTNAY